MDCDAGDLGQGVSVNVRFEHGPGSGNPRCPARVLGWRLNRPQKCSRACRDDRRGATAGAGRHPDHRSCAAAPLVWRVAMRTETGERRHCRVQGTPRKERRKARLCSARCLRRARQRLEGGKPTGQAPMPEAAAVAASVGALRRRRDGVSSMLGKHCQLRAILLLDV